MEIQAKIQSEKLPLGGLGGLILTRKHFLPNCTIGTLEVVYEDNPLCPIYICDTLEPHAIDWSKEKKVKGRTAIPCGQYKIEYKRSPKFGRRMPYLEDVPHFQGILIHSGNYPKDTQGCILVGVNPPMKQGIPIPKLTGSRIKFDMLNELIFNAVKDGEKVTVTITNKFQSQ